MIVMIANLKGGVSKSTIATNVAVELKQHGQNVRVIDLDNGNLTTSLFFDNRSDIDAFIPETYADISAVVKGFDGDIVIDAGGLDSDLLRGALVISDVIVIPYKKGKIEENALMGFIGVLNEIGSIVGKKRCVLTPSQFYHNTSIKTINKEVEALEDYGFVISTPIYQSSKYQEALGESLSVRELGDADKQVLEIELLLNTIKGKDNGNK